MNMSLVNKAFYAMCNFLVPKLQLGNEKKQKLHMA